MVRKGGSINLTRTELDALIRALRFEAAAMTAKAARSELVRATVPP
jgi:hypothetical protein